MFFVASGIDRRLQEPIWELYPRLFFHIDSFCLNEPMKPTNTTTPEPMNQQTSKTNDPKTHTNEQTHTSTHPHTTVDAPTTERRSPTTKH